MSGGQQLSNLKDVTGRLGKDKWKRAWQILRSYGLSGLLSRVRDKMQSGVDPFEETECSVLLSNESCTPKKMKPGSFELVGMVSFTVDPTATNAAQLELLTEGVKDGAQLRLEVFREGTRVADTVAPVPLGSAYTTVAFPPVFYPEDGTLTFVASVAGGSIALDRRKKAHDVHVAGGGKVFLRLYASTDPVYALWMHHNDPDAAELDRQRAAQFDAPVTFSVVVPLYNTPERYLREMIDSVRAQTYPHWELCLADGSTDGTDRSSIVESYSDARIRYTKLAANEGIAGNSNRAADMATGEFVCLLDHDDTLAPQALYAVASLLEENPEYDFIYSDEDKLSESGERRFFPFFKPDYSPNLLNSFNYITHFSVLRRSLLEDEALFRPGFDGAQDYDLILRATERARAVGHVPDILYHWRVSPASTAGSGEAKTYTEQAALLALNEALERRGIEGAKAVRSVQPNRFDIEYPVPDPAPTVSVLIPWNAGDEAGAACVQALRSSGVPASCEIIAAGPEEAMGRIPRGIKFLPQSTDLTTSGLLRAAAKAASGEILVFADPRITGTSDGWLRALVSQALRPDIGIAGGIVLSPNGTVRSAGYTLHAGEIASPAMKGLPADHPGSFGRLFAVRDVSAVSLSALAIRRDLFEEAGGLNPDFPEYLADVDLCLRVREMGKSVILTPGCRVCAAAGPAPSGDVELAARAKWLRTWLGTYPRDPYGNPNLDWHHADYSTYPGRSGEPERLALGAYRTELLACPWLEPQKRSEGARRWSESTDTAPLSWACDQQHDGDAFTSGLHRM